MKGTIAMDDEKVLSSSVAIGFEIGKLRAEFERLRDEISQTNDRLEKLVKNEAVIRENADRTLKSDLESRLNLIQTTYAKAASPSPPPATPASKPQEPKLPPFPSRNAHPRNSDYFKALEAWAKEVKKPIPPKPGPMQKPAAYDRDVASWLDRIGVKVKGINDNTANGSNAGGSR
jgi:hypothetical protein